MIDNSPSANDLDLPEVAVSIVLTGIAILEWVLRQRSHEPEYAFTFLAVKSVCSFERFDSE